MKYVVKLIKTIETTVVVDAEDDTEADAKLMRGEYEQRFDNVKTKDTYLGMEYQNFTKHKKDELICSIEDFAKWFSGTTPEHIERDMFKYTNCGMCIEWNEKGIELVGYVEGADCDMPSEFLSFPFTTEHAKSVIDYLEEEADIMWHEWNFDVEKDNINAIESN